MDRQDGLPRKRMVAGLPRLLRRNVADRELKARSKRTLAQLEWRYIQNHAGAKTSLLKRSCRGLGELAYSLPPTGYWEVVYQQKVQASRPPQQLPTDCQKQLDHLIALTPETCREQPIRKPPELMTVSATITLRWRNWSAI
jgi:hypothetical protein